MADTYRPPKGVQEEAQRALKWIADGKAGDGFTDTGRARAAQLARGDSLSESTVLRMYSYLSRHEVDKQGEGFTPGDDGYPSPGRVAWAAWGGDPGLEWSSKIRDSLAERSAILEESHMPRLIHLRAEGADVPLADALGYLLNEVFEFYAVAHRAHWNVVGSGADFQAFHDLFGEITGDVYGSVDPLAENIRKLGSLAPCLHVMPDGESRMTAPGDLAAMLLDENEELIASIRAAFDIATAAGQQGIANFLADRQDAHAKWSWQLRASLGIAEVGQPLSPEVAEPEMDEDEAETYSADPEVEARRALIAEAEKRTIETEVRASVGEDGMVRMVGYAATFNREADGLPFREVIIPGAFKRSLDRGDDVFLLVNHDTDELPLARRSSGTLTVTEDATGLLVEATLDPKNPRAAELASALERGDVDKMSFAFTVAPDGSTRTKDGLRELRDLNLFEVSVVTWPAYSDTTVGLRSADDDLAARWLAKKWDIKRRQHAR